MEFLPKVEDLNVQLAAVVNVDKVVIAALRRPIQVGVRTLPHLQTERLAREAPATVVECGQAAAMKMVQQQMRVTFRVLSTRRP